MFAEIGDGNIGAFPREQNGYRTADAGVGAGDQRDLSFQLLRAFVMWRIVHRREFKVCFFAWLLEMLLGEGWFWVTPRSGLHRPLALGLFLGSRSFFAIDLGLYLPLFGSGGLRCLGKAILTGAGVGWNRLVLRGQR